jgi:hypothetical protein
MAVTLTVAYAVCLRVLRGETLVIACLIALATWTIPAVAGANSKGGLEAGVGATGAIRGSGVNLGPGPRIGGGLIVIGILRNALGNLSRGGPGEGASAHISPTENWKGVVRTNICNFRYTCQ